MKTMRVVLMLIFVAMMGMLWIVGGRRELTLQEIAERCKNAVVRIDLVERSNGEKTRSSATGFFVGKHGRILTNAHVVKHESINPETWKVGPRAPSEGPHPDPATVECCLKLGDRYVQTALAGFDKYADLGLLDVHGMKKSEYSVLPIGDPSKLRVGDKVFVYGSSSGIEGREGEEKTGSATEGVVNCIGANQGYNFVEADIQVSANFAEGGSGSPLMNVYGEVVGVMYATARTTGLAIPITFFDEEQLSHGEVKLGYFGASIMPKDETPFGFSDDDFEAVGRRAGVEHRAWQEAIMKMIHGRGALVVLPKDSESPATLAGIELGDVIVELNGERIRTEMDLHFAIWRAPLGKPIAVKVVRFDEGGKKSTLVKTVTLAYGS